MKQVNFLWNDVIFVYMTQNESKQEYILYNYLIAYQLLFGLVWLGFMAYQPL